MDDRPFFVQNNIVSVYKGADFVNQMKERTLYITTHIKLYKGAELN